MTYNQGMFIGEGGFEPGRRRPPRAEALRMPEGGGAFERASPQPARLAALIVSSSSGWENYRHQADALRQYRRLRDNRVPDADIVMIGADEPARAVENPQPEIVRNLPGGEDLYEEVVYDYNLTLESSDLEHILSGEVMASTPTVLDLDADTNLLIFLAGHGGTPGIALDAEAADDALLSSSDASIISPDQLTSWLCALRRQQRVRRVLVVIEACYSGVFGDTNHLGVEAGCEDDEPLEGVLVFTAANTRRAPWGRL